MTIKVMPSRGEMKFRVVLQQKTNTPNGSGGFTTTWATWATLWAFFDSWKGKKTLIDQQVAQYMILRMVTPYYTDATSGNTPDSSMRVLYEGRYMNIESVYDVSERHEYLEYYLTEGIAT